MVRTRKSTIWDHALRDERLLEEMKKLDEESYEMARSLSDDEIKFDTESEPNHDEMQNPLQFGNKGFDEMATTNEPIYDAKNIADNHAFSDNPHTACQRKINDQNLEIAGLKARNREIERKLEKAAKDVNIFKTHADEATARANGYFNELSELKEAMKGISFNKASETLKNEYFVAFIDSHKLTNLLSNVDFVTQRPLRLTIKSDTKNVVQIE